VTTALYVACYALLSTGGVLLLRTALKDVDQLSTASVRNLVLEPAFLFGFLLYALSFLTWLLALRRHELVVIFPVFVAVSYVCVVLGGHLFLGESLSTSRVVGIVVIFVGTALLFR
jgi:drug/metabolite transporter (DMT)-like permease